MSVRNVFADLVSLSITQSQLLLVLAILNQKYVVRVINQLFIIFTMQFETRWIGKLQTLLWLRLRQTSVLGGVLGETCLGRVTEKLPKSPF